ncbi:hypothetical protein Bpla01_42530 [Burkholderia plantarii]|nr:hypothetical protein Bpla01_42530 [Burkholderia plantarii]
MPLKVAVQLVLIVPFVSVVAPVAENGSPEELSGLPLASVTVTANAGAASADETARATTREATFRIVMMRASIDDWRRTAMGKRTSGGVPPAFREKPDASARMRPVETVLSCRPTAPSARVAGA